MGGREGCDEVREVVLSVPLAFEGDNNNSNNNERISSALFHVKHAQLRKAGANTKIENACI